MNDVAGRPTESIARNIVNQLFDLAEVPVGERQSINDKADAWVTELLSKWAAQQSLTFEKVRAVNRERCERWHPNFPNDELWNGADWSNAMQGESGEAGNVVKKLRRLDIGAQDWRIDTSTDEAKARAYEELLVKLEDECADVFLYLDLLAQYYGINLPEAIRRKFNRVSEEQGFPDRL